VYLVACPTHATLKQPSSGDVESTEDIITGDTVELMKLARALEKLDPERMNILNSLLRPDLQVAYVTFKKTDSILCYFFCSSVEQIWQLRCWYKSGRLQTLLESVFTLLVGSKDMILIDQLTWNQDNYNESLVRLSQLKALGMHMADRKFLLILSIRF
jgi:hypothetical protein